MAATTTETTMHERAMRLLRTAERRAITRIHNADFDSELDAARNNLAVVRHLIALEEAAERGLLNAE